MVEYSEDIKACLIAGTTIYVGNVPIHSVSFKKISEAPMSLYFNVLGILTMPPSEIERRFDNDEMVKNAIDILHVMHATNKELFSQYNTVFKHKTFC